MPWTNSKIFGMQRIGPSGRLVLCGIGVILGIAVVSYGVPYFLQLAAATLAVASGVCAWRLVPSERRSSMGWRALAETAGPALLIGLTLAVYWPLVRGHMPWEPDHLVHETKAYILADRLLPTGRLFGWTLFSGPGYPAERLYPVLGDAWMAFVRYATFKSLSWEATYAYGLLGVLLFVNLSAYFVGRRLFGPVAGLVAGLAMLTDYGWFREGGWMFTVQFGVWPLQLSVAFSMLLVERLWSLREAGPTKGVVSTAVIFALALLAHPMSLLFAVVALPLWGLVEWVWSGRAWVWRKTMAAGAIGVGLAAFWVLPYLARAGEFSAHSSALWKSISDIGRGIVVGDLYHSADPWFFVLGFFGLAWAWRQGRPMGRFLGFLVVVLLLVASTTFYAATRAEYVLRMIQHVQFERFVVYVKFSLFLGAGFALQQALSGRIPHGAGFGPWPGGTSRPAMPHAARLLVSFVVAVLLTPLVVGWTTTRLSRLTGFKTRGDRMGLYLSMRALLDRVKREAEARPKGYFRVAYVTGFNDHRLANGPIYSGLPFVKCSYYPAETYRYLVHPQPKDVPDTERDFDVLAVRFVLATRPLPARLRHFKLLEQRGPLRLYENEAYRPLLATLRGPGTVRVTKWEDERIELQVSGLPSEADLVLHVPYFPNWRAYQDGRRLHIWRTDDLAPHVPGLMTVRVRNGTVVFRYGSTAVDVLGWLTSLASIGVCVFLWAASRRPWRLPELLWRRFRRLDLVGNVATGLGLAAGFAGVMVLVAGMGSRTERKEHSLIWRLDRARVYLEGPSGRTGCRPFLDGRYWCGKKSYEHVDFAVEEWNLKSRRGLWAHPYPGRDLVIEFPKTKLGRYLEIDYGILQSGAAGKGIVTLTVYVDGRLAGSLSRSAAGWATKRLDTSRWAGTVHTVQFRVSATDVGARHFCFDPKIVP